MLRTILALLWFRDTVRSETQVLAVALAAAGAVVAIAPVPAADTAEPLQRHTLFVGVDTSGSFRHAARITKERNLVLTPITVVVVSDGIPDVPGVKAGAPDSFKTIDLGALEFLSRNVTVRLIYASPKVGELWRTRIPRQRVRLWAVEREVMMGWRAQMKPKADRASQDRVWKWVGGTVD